MSREGDPSAYQGFQGFGPRRAMFQSGTAQGSTSSPWEMNPPGSFQSSSSNPPGGFEPPMTQGETHPHIVPPLVPHGTAGAKIELVSNFYKLNIYEMTIFHYDIEVVKVMAKKSTEAASSQGGDISFQSATTARTSSFQQQSAQPERSSPTASEAKMAESRARFIKRFASDIVKQFTTDCSKLFAGVRYCFDGQRSLYVSQKLDLTETKVVSQEVTLDIDCRPATFKVTMKFAKSYNMAEVLQHFTGTDPALKERSVQIYDAVMRAIMSTNYALFQRKFYNVDAVSRGRTICDFVQGFQASVVPTEIGLTLNLHNKTAAVVGKDHNRLIDLVQAIQPAVREGNQVQRNQLSEVNKFLRFVKFSTMHGTRELRYTIDCLVERTPYELSFAQNETRITVAEYFQQAYSINCLLLPTIKTVGARFHYIPLELGVLKGTTFLANSKLNASVQRELLALSTLKPNVYFARTTEIAKRLAAADREMQAAFNVSLNTTPINLTARVLNAPQVLNADKRMPFYEPGTPPTTWCIFALSNQEITAEQLGYFADGLINRARTFGLNLAMADPIALVDIGDKVENIYNLVKNIKLRVNSDFVFLGIPRDHPHLQGPSLYNYVKFLCDKEFSIVNQCFRIENALDLPAGYFDQFLLKTNAKMGGRNAVIAPEDLRTLSFDAKWTMMIGLDISHPSTGEHVLSSVAAAVGSIDEMWSQYTASVRVQRRGRSEIIEVLGEMIFELLVEWLKTHHNELPRTLIVFRDGVSDAEMEVVRLHEIPLIQGAVNRAGKRIPLMFILTNKNHSVRFARQTLCTDTKKPTFNVPSGTVVDSTITNPKEFAFFLNSHFSPLGTSKSTKYTVLHNDLNMDADQLQKMVYFSCFNSARTRSVISQPTAVRYADLLASRSKAIIEARLTTHMEMESSSQSQEEFEEGLIKLLNTSVKVDDSLKRKLYYC